MSDHPGPERRTGRLVWLIAAATPALYVLLALNQTAIWERASWHATPRAGAAETAGLLAAFAGINACLLVGYVLVVHLARRPLSRAGTLVVLGLPSLVMIGLLAVRPAFSIDVLSYLAHGAAGLMNFPADAYSLPPTYVTAIPYGQALLEQGWNPAPGTSPYGPLWTLMETGVVLSGIGVQAGVIVFKAIAVASALASGALIWRILGVVRPQAQLAGTAAFLWNPVVILELAAEGHNDGLMVMFALFALYAIVRGRPAASLLASAGGTLVKYLPALFVLPGLAYGWRVAHDRRRYVVGVAIGVVGGVVLAELAYLPFMGPHLLDGVLRSNAGGSWPLWHSVTGLVRAAYDAWLPMLDPAVGRTVLLGGLFAVVVLFQTSRSTTPDRLIRACATIAITYIYVLSAAFWPWYAVLPIAFLAMERGRSSWVLLLVVTVASRVAAPLGALPVDVPFAGAAGTVTLVAVLVVLAATIVTRWGGSASHNLEVEPAR